MVGKPAAPVAGCRPASRPGGRSARVQAAVHRAVGELLATAGREALTVPLIAARAGVTPSTIYRRWGDLQDLLADVAVERLRPDGDPAETGSGRGDLLAWAEHYADEMSSGPGREMIRDVLCVQDSGNAGRCWSFTRGQIGIISARATARGEVFPDAQTIMDRLVSPLLCRILFDLPPDEAAVAGLVDDALGRGRLPQAGTSTGAAGGGGGAIRPVPA